MQALNHLDSFHAFLQNGNPLPIILSIVLVSLLPFVILSLTSFIKLSVVFGIVRNALGAQQIPSTAITTLLCIVLTMHIMKPVAEEVLEATRPLFTSEKVVQHSKGNQKLDIFSLFEAAAPPILKFLLAHSGEKERQFFLASANQSGEKLTVQKAEMTQRHAALPPAHTKNPLLQPGESFFSLVPAFVLSQLREAFAIGFLFFLPFLVIDLVVANLLVGVGMNMVSPITISLPIKILVFAACDAWLLICRSLILSYS